ncbi:MAG: conjugal transfer protein TraL [Bacteroidota bacterium]
MTNVHMTLQGKGGIGKSLIASFIAQYVQEGERPLLAIDTDPVNATLAGFQRLKARRLELLRDGQVDAAAFDDMVEMILDHDGDVVVDNGASSFLPLSNYLLENPALTTLEAHGRRVLIHSVITGGSAMMETMDGFRQVAQALPPNVGIVVWLNEYFGPIEASGQTFRDSKTFQEAKERIRGLVVLPRRTPETFGRDLREMSERRQTFAESIADGAFRLMAKQRLTMMRREVFEQIASVL